MSKKEFCKKQKSIAYYIGNLYHTVYLYDIEKINL